MNLSWNLRLLLVKTFLFSFFSVSILQPMYALLTFWGFCGLIELSRKLKKKSIIFSQLTLGIFIFRQHTRNRTNCDAKNEKCKNRAAELVAQFEWVHWLSCAASFFLSYTRLLMWLARINIKIVYIVRAKKKHKQMSEKSRQTPTSTTPT
jgi:hypothetical protein